MGTKDVLHMEASDSRKINGILGEIRNYGSTTMKDKFAFTTGL